MNNKIYGLIGLARRAGKINFGTESSLEIVKNGKAKLVIIAEDAAERTKKNFKIECEKMDVPFRVYGNIEEFTYEKENIPVSFNKIGDQISNVNVQIVTPEAEPVFYEMEIGDGPSKKDSKVIYDLIKSPKFLDIVKGEMKKYF